MGLIKALMGAAGGTMADQWKEYFYCEAMDADTLVMKGQKRAVLPTTRAAIISSRTVPESQWRTASA